jgi:hypothetical protein
MDFRSITGFAASGRILTFNTDRVDDWWGLPSPGVSPAVIHIQSLRDWIHSLPLAEANV